MKKISKYILALFLIFIILFMSYWNTHKINEIENFTPYLNTIYNQTRRNCNHFTRNATEYFSSKSGYLNYFNSNKK